MAFLRLSDPFFRLETTRWALPSRSSAASRSLGFSTRVPVGIGDQMGDAAVESDHGLATRRRKLGAERLELVNLVESVRIEANGTPEPKLSLLERKVPQKAERGLPAQQAFLLLSAWVNSRNLNPL